MNQLVTARNEPPTGYSVWKRPEGGPMRWRWARTEWLDAGECGNRHGGEDSRDEAVRAAWRDHEWECSHPIGGAPR